MASPVQHFLAALHVEPEMGERQGGGVGIARQQVPRPLILHLLLLLPLLPSPLALLVARKQKGRAEVRDKRPNEPPSQLPHNGIALTGFACWPW